MLLSNAGKINRNINEIEGCCDIFIESIIILYGNTFASSLIICGSNPVIMLAFFS